MFHACVRIFDVMGTVEIFLGTKHGLSKAKVRITPLSISWFNFAPKLCHLVKDKLNQEIIKKVK